MVAVIRTTPSHVSICHLDAQIHRVKLELATWHIGDDFIVVWDAGVNTLPSSFSHLWMQQSAQQKESGDTQDSAKFMLHILSHLLQSLTNTSVA